MNITVTHTLAPEVIGLLQNLSNSLSATEKIASPEQIKEAAPVKKLKAEKPVTVAKETEEKDHVEKVETGAEKEPITFQILRPLVQQKAQAGKREEIKKLLSDFGADKLSALSDEHYDEFYKKINLL